MNKKWLWLVSAFGAVAYFEYTRYMKLLDSISYVPTNVRISRQGEFLQINFILRIKNATDKSLELDSVYAELFEKDLLLGTFVMNQKVNIKANSITDVEVKGLTSATQLLNLIAKGNVLGATYTLKSTSNIKFTVLGLIAIPVSKIVIDSEITLKISIIVISKPISFEYALVGITLFSFSIVNLILNEFILKSIFYCLNLIFNFQFYYNV